MKGTFRATRSTGLANGMEYRIWTGEIDGQEMSLVVLRMFPLTEKATEVLCRKIEDIESGLVNLPEAADDVVSQIENGLKHHGYRGEVQ